MTNLYKHPHVCGAKDVEGFNDTRFSALSMIKFIIQHVPSYEKPYKDKEGTIGYGYYTMCVANTPWLSKATAEKRVKSFEGFISKNKLGTLVVGDWVGNPNYNGRHEMLPMIFMPDNVAMREFGIKKKWIERKQSGVVMDDVYGVYPGWAIGELNRP